MPVEPRHGCLPADLIYRTVSKIGCCRTSFLLVLAHFACCLGIASVGFCNDRDSELCLDRMIGNREQIYAGDYAMRGVHKLNTVVKGVATTASRDINERIKFDFSQGVLRHEKEIGSLGDPESVTPPRQVLLYGADASYRQSVDAKRIDVGQKSEPQDFFDPRIAGMCSIAGFEKSVRLSLLTEAFRAGLNEHRFSVQDADDEILIAVLNVPQNEGGKFMSRRRLWIDKNRGYVPIRMEMQWNEAFSTDEATPRWGKPFETGEATWEEMQGVWVPTSASITLSQQAPVRQYSEVLTYDLAFQWFAVNPEYDPAEFLIETLDIPKGSHLIVDSSGNRSKPVITQHPNVPNADELRRIVASNPSNTDMVVASRRSWILMAANVIVLVLLILFWSWRRRNNT